MPSGSIRHDAASAIPLALAAVATFALFDGTIKMLGALAPLVLVVWARFSVQTLFALAIGWSRRRQALLRTQQPGLQALRGLALASLSALAFASLRVTPVGEFTAIVMLSPLLITLLAAWLLGERVSRARWVLMGVGLGCALVVIRPQGGDRGFEWAMLLPLLLVVANAAFHILSSRLARTDHPMTTQFYTGLTGMLVASALLPWAWQALPARTWGLIGLAAMLSSFGHQLLITAYGRAPASTLTPYLYFQIAFATLAGWLMFGHVPDAMALAGIAGIVACGAMGQRLSRHEAASAQDDDAAAEVGEVALAIEGQAAEDDDALRR